MGYRLMRWRWAHARFEIWEDGFCFSGRLSSAVHPKADPVESENGTVFASYIEDTQASKSLVQADTSEIIKQRNNPSYATDSESESEDLDPRDKIKSRKGRINTSSRSKPLPKASRGRGERLDDTCDDSRDKRKKRSFFRSSGFAMPFPFPVQGPGQVRKGVVDEIKGFNGVGGYMGSGVGIGNGVGGGEWVVSRAGSPASVV